MANKRNLKKQINHIASELFTECLIQSLYVPGTDKQKADQLMGRILRLQDEFLARISHVEPGSVKPFFKKLRADFNSEVSAILDELGQLNG
ncbi:MAG: hypothetical protein ACI38V_03345 [Bacteroides sp.]